MTINYYYECDFELSHEKKYSDWISRILISENSILGPISYIFCDDAYLLNLNQKFLEHNTLTDIITFDYSEASFVSGDIFISVERVEENALEFDVNKEIELKRVMAHGLLHLLGYNDKSENEKLMMRTKENEKMKLFHVEQ